MIKKNRMPEDGSFGVNENALQSSYLENMKFDVMYHKDGVINEIFGKNIVFSDATNVSNDYY